MAGRNQITIFALAISPAAIFALVAAGCAKPLQRPFQPSACAPNAADAVKSISAKSRKILPFKADGRCTLEYHGQGGRQYKERLPIKLRIQPPAKIYIQGDPALVPKAVLLGANENEYWLALKPKQINTYWWGRVVDLEQCTDPLWLSPHNFLEALGVVDLADENGWKLVSDGLLERRVSDTRLIKRVHFDCTGYLVTKIEYLDESGGPKLILTMGGYKEIAAGFFVPTNTKITRPAGGYGDDFAEISLDSVKPAAFSYAQQNLMFSRPQPRGFEHIYMIGPDCELLKQ